MMPTLAFCDIRLFLSHFHAPSCGNGTLMPVDLRDCQLHAQAGAGDRTAAEKAQEDAHGARMSPLPSARLDDTPIRCSETLRMNGVEPYE